MSLALGLGAGGIAAGILRRKEPNRDPTEAINNRIEDIDERTDQLLAQLGDLQQQAPRLEHDNYAQQRSEAEAQAAALLRERDELLAQRQAVQSRSANKEKSKPAPAPGSGVKGFVWGAGAMGVIAFLVISAMDAQTPRQPGQSVTGNAQIDGEAPRDAAPQGVAPPASRGVDAETSKQMQELVQHLKKHPADVDKLVELGRLLLKAQMFKQAEVVTDRALQLDPENTLARVHAALLEGARGDTERALQKLGSIVEAHPDVADAWFFRGMLAMQAGRQELMRESWQQFVELAPESPRSERIRAMLDGSGPQRPQ